MTTKYLRDLPLRDRNHPQRDWRIGPVGRSRESEPIEESNWRVMLRAYQEVDPEGTDHEVHYFRHWAVGWIEEVAYRPGSKVAEVAEQLRAQMANYPILDEHDLSELEHEMGLDEDE